VAHDVFISYAAEDKTIADAVCAVLEQRSIRCWIAPRDVSAGADYASAIVDAIREAKVLVLVFSSHANESPHVRREVERAVSNGIAILPFRIEDVLPSPSLEYFISDSHWLDALTPPVEAHLENLAETTAFVVARSGAPPRQFRGDPAPPRRRRLPVIAAAVGALVLVVAVAVIAAVLVADGDGGGKTPSDTSGSEEPNPDEPTSWYTTDRSLPALMPDCNGVFGLCLGSPIEQAEILFGVEEDRFDGPDGVTRAWDIGPIGVSVTEDDVGSIVRISANIAEGERVALGLPHDLLMGEATMGDVQGRWGRPYDTELVEGENLVIYKYLYQGGGEGVEQVGFSYGTIGAGFGGRNDPGGFNEELETRPVTGFAVDYGS
jgi:hypothetical protein